MAPVAAPTPTPAAAAAPPAGAAPATNNEAQKKSNRIQVSNTKKPLFFYVNLAKVRHDSEVDSLFEFDALRNEYLFYSCI